MTYFLRRLGLGLVCIFWIEFFWGQIAIQLMTSVFVIILLHWAKPMGSRFDTYIETFNEIITLITLYCLMCFSDFILDEQRRSELGHVFIATICLFAVVHIYLLFGEICWSISHLIKKIYYNHRNRAILDARIEKREMKESWIVVRRDYHAVMD